VAGFIGSPQMNFLPCEIITNGVGMSVRLADGRALALPAGRLPASAQREGLEAVLGIRPTSIALASAMPPRSGTAREEITVDLIQPTGPRSYISFTLGGTELMAEVSAHDVTRAGATVTIDIDMNHAVLIDPKTNRVFNHERSG
jgi:multiple sugar transport system ATP-binding protein